MTTATCTAETWAQVTRSRGTTADEEGLVDSFTRGPYNNAGDVVISGKLRLKNRQKTSFSFYHHI